ncbi:SDR family oxidoreductase [Chiayiivirga flava]|uniref:Nucleoside-diphosphate-sugar epimerase n=1 Tax=Chiayiivirga flava TaxID=659595 RepID=A0A7W8FYN6_9GAMM|nr:nucleoside-diphosphate sugar epimerase [Chiayiivirga flava]MBB5207592.1 nucleoside-diphosphate-sugar epimerase [Chiayiivirga flava]
MNRSALVFGARGQIGVGLLPRLLAHGLRVRAITRGDTPASPHPALRWQRFDLFGSADPPQEEDLVFSLGPLDGFLRWLERVPAAPRRVVAFGSTSATTKRDSIDARERDLAQRLAALETRLATVCAERGITWTLLRPTLVYGVGRDRSLTRIATLARRFGLFALARGATGLRQPVHAHDLAAACFQAALVSAAANRAYDFPGGETLRYDEMVRRTLACLVPPPRLMRVPDSVLRIALASARRVGKLRDAGPGVLQRLRSDLVFDGSDAVRDLGIVPRPFVPEAGMFEAAVHDRECCGAAE